MATGLPHSVSIHGTSATDGAQSFAVVNLGTINHARSDNISGELLSVISALLTITDTGIW